MAETWVLNDTQPKTFTVGGGDDLTTASSVDASMSKDGTVVSLPVSVVDATTVTLDRDVEGLTVGTWRLEVQATYSSGVQTFPEDSPVTVSIRDEIVT